ncbi:MAG: GNAT family N-acetyltransferase [Chitinophagaceae bacterium]|nr:GNAT family N-acetyltransferase [Chitinophagaceae bacterium]
MNHLLDNPVFNALCTGDKHLGSGNDKAKYFFEEVSPFVSFETGYTHGFRDLYEMLPEKRGILYANPKNVDDFANWRLLDKIEGVQMIHESERERETERERVNKDTRIVSLNKDHVPGMIGLAKLTKPGPFGPRTIEFGHYFGIFENGKLIAMAGQRMHINNYSEVSAVCTHPDALGKGYATLLVQHQLKLIYEQGQRPFLHVRADNARAIKVYERLGFSIRSGMIFYLLRK